MQYLRFQIDNSPKQVTEGILTLIDLSLIHDKPTMEKAGLMHDEKVIKEDMSAIYDRFHDSTVNFFEPSSSENCRIDYSQGKPVIYLPKPKSMENISESLTLKTAYFNVGIEKNQKNTEAQQGLNAKALEHLGFGSSDERFAFLREKKTLSDDDAVLLMKLLRENSQNAVFGIHSYSAKDRTSLIGGKDAGGITEKTLTEKRNRPVSAVTLGRMGSDSLAVAAIEKNTGKMEVKLDPRTSERSWADPADLVYGSIRAKIEGKAGGGA